MFSNYQPNSPHISSARITVLAAAILALIVLALGGCTQPSLGDSDEAAPPLYEITNPSGEVEGWMLGTIHALPDNVEWRTREIAQVIDQADALVVEIAELDQRDDVQATFLRLATTPGQVLLTSRIEPEYRAQLQDLIKRSGRNLSDFESVETWAAALMLAQVSSFGDPANGVDLAVLEDFEDKPVHEFEGSEAQLSIFDQLDEADQRDLLRGVVQDTALADADPGKLARAWFTGDKQELIEATSTGIMGDRELRNALLVQRNIDWAQDLLARLEKPERPLVAVGAAHLVGPDGLVRMLESEGYSVRSLH